MSLTLFETITSNYEKQNISISLVPNKCKQEFSFTVQKISFIDNQTNLQSTVIRLEIEQFKSNF